MPRKGHTQKRDVLADPMYNSKVVTKLINNIMLDGKKGVAQKIVYGAFERIADKSEKPAIEVFEEAMNNIMPVLEVKARRMESKLSGANRGKSRQKTDFSASLAYNIFPSERREDNGRKTGK